MDGQVGATSQFDKGQVPLATKWLGDRGHKVEYVDCIQYDAVVNELKERISNDEANCMFAIRSSALATATAN